MLEPTREQQRMALPLSIASEVSSRSCPLGSEMAMSKFQRRMRSRGRVLLLTVNTDFLPLNENFKATFPGV